MSEKDDVTRRISAEEYDSDSTRRVSSTEMNHIRELLDQQTVELTVEVTPAVMARIDALLPRLEVEDGSSPELHFAMSIRQIFMTGLYTLEHEFGDE